MKAYIKTIELEESNPLIRRRIVMLVGATFNRLHDVIQRMTNFKSGYPYGSYHFFEFDLTEDHKMVTDNEEAYLENQPLTI